MSVSLRTEGESGVVHYDVETSAGGRGIVVYEVNEVYVYIPAELSAAGFELKIAGCVRITDKVSGACGDCSDDANLSIVLL